MKFVCGYPVYGNMYCTFNSSKELFTNVNHFCLPSFYRCGESRSTTHYVYIKKNSNFIFYGTLNYNNGPDFPLIQQIKDH